MEETLEKSKNYSLSHSELENKENKSIGMESNTSENVTIASSKKQISIQSPLNSQNLNKNYPPKAPNGLENRIEKSIEQQIKKQEKNANLSKYSEESERVASKMHSKNHFLFGKIGFT